MSNRPAPVVEMELYLVRHGESYGNISCESLERTPEEAHDPHLSPLGKAQAELLGKHFSHLPLNHILASGLRRAVDTASAVAACQPEDGTHTVEVHPIFTECGATEDYAGRTISEIQAEHKLAVPAIGTEDIERFIVWSGARTDDLSLARANKAIRYLRSRFTNGEKVLVAAHGCFNTFLLFAALGLSDHEVFDPSFFNAGVTKIIFYKEGTGPYEDISLVYHNDRSHLYTKFPELLFGEQ